MDEYQDIIISKKIVERNEKSDIAVICTVQILKRWVGGKTKK